MTIKQIENIILNERGYIRRDNDATTAELYDRNGALIQRIPLATVERVAALRGVEKWKTSYFGEYIAHYLCKEYTQHENAQHCRRIADELTEYAKKKRV